MNFIFSSSSSLFLEELRALTSIYKFFPVILCIQGIFRHQVGLADLVDPVVGHPVLAVDAVGI
jgi:hypothetical protein